MAVVITLVESSPNRLRYLCNFAPGGDAFASITSTGAATPDLLTDSLAGPLKKLAKVISDGFGAFASGAQTQAKARALWLSDSSGADPSPGDPVGALPLLPTAICRLAPRGNATPAWMVDADVSAGNPIITVTLPVAPGFAASCYLDIDVPEAIG